MSAAVQVDDTDPTPPYEQLRRQLVALIEGGALAVGARLPTVRQLAADLGLASGTVARTYRELEQAGLVATRRGAGTRVAAVGRGLSDTERRRRVDAVLADAVRQVRLLGADDAAVRAALEAALGDPPG